jgi:uncharacterized protein
MAAGEREDRKRRIDEALREWNPWWDTHKGAILDQRCRLGREALEDVIPWLGRIPVLAICGMRRCGKSTLMHQLVRHLLRSKTVNNPHDVVLANFEETVFLEERRDTRALDLLFEVYRETARPSGKPWVFLDEVQNIDGWARWVRAASEKGLGTFVVSGSSSKIIEPELGSVLTGRHQSFTLWPFSYRELLRLRHVDIEQIENPDQLESHSRMFLPEYLRHGGMPEIRDAQFPRHLRDGYLRQLFRDILYKDIVQRHEVRAPRALEEVAHYFLVNTGRLAPYNRVKNRYGLVMDQVRDYAGYLQESYLIGETKHFSYKVSEQANLPRKVYARDTGLRNAVSFRSSPDTGHLAETVVFNHLSRDEGVELLHFRKKRECDFVVWKDGRPIQAIQVCTTPDGVLPEREEAGLREAMESLSIPSGLLITTTSALSSSDERVRIVPLDWWLFLTGEDRDDEFGQDWS